MVNLEWSLKSFKQLSVSELYDILNLRSEVFVVEQNAAYLDPDNKDQKALHLFAYSQTELIAYCRLFKRGDYFEEASIGRVVVARKYRKYGIGHQLLNKGISAVNDNYGEQVITISAQLYLQHFYETHGFLKVSDVYEEDGIPHIRMKLYPNEKK